MADMTALLSLFPGWIWAGIATAAAVLVGLWHSYTAGRKAGEDSARLDSYERELRDLDRANAARTASLRRSADGGLLDDDGWRRRD